MKEKACMDALSAGDMGCIAWRDGDRDGEGSKAYSFRVCIYV